MRQQTVDALARINGVFYEETAMEFSATRERPWPAWERLAEIVAENRGRGSLAVLDLGCGNGRLGRFLAGRWDEGLCYLGIDASESLLGIARRLGGGCYARRDLLTADRFADLPAGPFDLVAAFGLLHHLPGFAGRAALLEEAAGQLAPGGLLAVSFWQFGALERFRRRTVPWPVYNRTASEPIDTDELEEGDVLLAWGGEPGGGGGRPAVRYCHWAPPEEVDRLVAGLPLDPLAEFRADGRSGDLNLYRVLRAPHGLPERKRWAAGARVE